jgi:hypothetical protein
MKEFARICMGADPDLAGKLEQALNSEIAIQNEPKANKTFKEVEVHPLILA